MSTPTATSRADHETVYRLLLDERWTELLDIIHEHRQEIGSDPLLRHAVDVFTDTFVKRIEKGDTESLKADLEKLFLLHVGGFHVLQSEHFELVVVALVQMNGERPDAAAGYARHCPEHPLCADVLDRVDVRQEVAHEQRGRIDLHETRPSTSADHTVPLFRSAREIAFFMAVREVFATYLVYPNVAISSLLDFDALKELLTAEERSFFFRGVVDCVVFDQHGDYRPMYFFEVDSPVHDDERRRSNDAKKDRILSAAGQRLHRVRPRDPSAGHEDYVRLLRELMR